MFPRRRRWSARRCGGRATRTAGKGTTRQNEGPLAKETSGPLATEAIVQGTSDVTFNGSDPGAGVWEVTFQVDGAVASRTGLCLRR